MCVSKAWPWFPLSFAVGLSQSRFLCTIRRVSISCAPAPPACPWSWAPGWGQEVFLTPTPPLASAQPSCARRAGCTFPYLQHKTSLFLHPGHVHAQSAGDGRRAGDRPCRSTASFPRYLGILFVSHPMGVISGGGLSGQSPWCRWCGVSSASGRQLGVWGAYT